MFAFNRTIMLMCSWLHQTCVCGDVDVVTAGSIIYLQKQMLQNWKSIFIAVCGSRIFPTLLNAVTWHFSLIFGRIFRKFIREVTCKRYSNLPLSKLNTHARYNRIVKQKRCATVKIRKCVTDEIDVTRTSSKIFDSETYLDI